SGIAAECHFAFTAMATVSADMASFDSCIWPCLEFCRSASGIVKIFGDWPLSAIVVTRAMVCFFSVQTFWGQDPVLERRGAVDSSSPTLIHYPGCICIIRRKGRHFLHKPSAKLLGN